MGSDFRARRGLRALVVTAVLATSASLVAAPATTAAADTATNAQRAQRGAQWLANQIKANGGVIVSFGAPPPPHTPQAAIGVCAGRDAKTLAPKPRASPSK